MEVSFSKEVELLRPFLTGCVENNPYLGGPVGFLQMKDCLAARFRRPRWRDLSRRLHGPMRSWSAAAVSATLLAALAGAPAARAAEANFEICAGCHGIGGVSFNVDTPSLAGQPSFYAITQLFLFRAGRRTNRLMTEVASGMSDAELRAYSELVGQLPAAPPAPGLPADPARMKRGAMLAEQHRCTSCHGADLAGAKQVPRLAGQREEYLARALAEFRSGARGGYTQAMNGALAGLDAAELEDLAHYIAHASAPTAVAPATSSASR